MRPGKLTRYAYLLAAVFAASAGHSAPTPAAAPDTAGLVLDNRASASYDAVPSGVFQVFSQTTTLTVGATSGVGVTPDDVATSGYVQPDAIVTRSFTLANLGNQDDQFRITAATVSTPAALVDIHFDVNGDGVPDPGDIPVLVGTTPSPATGSGSSIDLLVRYSTAGISTGTDIEVLVTAETLAPGAVNGLSSDDGRTIDSVTGRAVFTSPTNPAEPPLVTIDGRSQINGTPNQEVLVEGFFANSGTADATNTVVSVPFTSGLTYVPGSFLLDGNPATDGIDLDPVEVTATAILVRLPQVTAGQAHQFAFRTRVDTSVAGSSLLAITATFSADAVAATPSTAATVLVDPFGVAFDAATQNPVGGVDLVLLSGPSPAPPIALPPAGGAGAPPNVDNLNPFTSDGTGRFSFLLDPSQAGSPGAPETYVLAATREGFLPRQVEVMVEGAGGSGSTTGYDLTLTSLDGLPLAQRDGFTLDPDPLQLTAVGAVAFNLPFFTDGALTVTKTSDRSHAEVGASLGYRVRVANQGALPLTNVSIIDELPQYLDPVEGASQLLRAGSTASIVFSAAGRTLTFPIGGLEPGESAELAYRVRVAPGAPAAPIQNLASVTATLPGGEQTSAGPARAVVFVSQGVFSFQQVLVGRVFEDLDGDGMFGPNDEAVSGARVVLDNGMSSTTDSEGLYSMPSVPEGSRMVGIDPTTYPGVLCPVRADHFSETGLTRLLRTPVGGGALLRQNFALTNDPDCAERFGDAQTLVEAAQTNAPTSEQLPASTRASITPTDDVTEVAGQTEELARVEPRDLEVLWPPNGSSTPYGAVDLRIRTHRTGALQVRVNGIDVGDDRIGQTDIDPLNDSVTFHYFGIPVRAGPNRVTARAVDSDGRGGFAEELTVYGPGAPVELTIDTDRTSLPADGASTSGVHVGLADAWGRPAQDSRVRIETSAGLLTAEEDAIGARELLVSTRSGSADATLTAGLRAGPARIVADLGDQFAETEIYLLPEDRPEILIGMTELSLGSTHSSAFSGGSSQRLASGLSGRTAFYYKGPAPFGSQLTTAFDSERRLNRTNDTNRLFDLDPLSRLYPVMGDSSTHFQETESNSRAFIKVEKDRSSVTWGDFSSDFGRTALVGSSRRLTGLRVHLEEEFGDHLTLALAEPDNTFIREVIPAIGLGGFYRLKSSPVVPGSDRILLEIHDRRSPEIVLDSTPLVRGLDYDLDPLAGTVVFKRPVESFTPEFDLVEIVALYEVETTDMDGVTWATRGAKSWDQAGTELGFSIIGEDQSGSEAFHMVGVDWNQQLPDTGSLSFEFAHSAGVAPGLAPSLTGSTTTGGSAFRGEIDRDVPSLRGPVRFSFLDVARGFQNPFGASVTPGMRKFGFDWEPVVAESTSLKVFVQQERNQTDAVDNSRTTSSLESRTLVVDGLLFTAGYGHRRFSDRTSNREIGSDLVSAGIEYQPTPRWKLSLRREQNLTSESDPSYPDSTFLKVGFQQNPNLLYFARMRDSSRAIEAIADVSAAGLTPRRSAAELQFGVESRVGTYSTLTSRYQLENGINGVDSFSVVGLGTRIPLNEEFALDFRGEAGLHMTGGGDSFESLTTGFSWLPEEDLRATLRYEFRNAGGFGQTISANVVGQIGPGVTLLARLASSSASQLGLETATLSFLGGAALRPLGHDRMGVFLHWSREDRAQGALGQNDARALTDTFSADSVFQLSARIRYFLKTALMFSEDKPDGLLPVQSTTTLLQNRLEYRIGQRWDVTGEFRSVYLWQDHLTNNHLGVEAGFWMNESMRIGVGYAVAGTRAVEGEAATTRGGVYLNLTSSANLILDVLRGAL